MANKGLCGRCMEYRMVVSWTETWPTLRITMTARSCGQCRSAIRSIMAWLEFVAVGQIEGTTILLTDRWIDSGQAVGKSG